MRASRAASRCGVAERGGGEALAASAWVDAQERGWTRPNIPGGKGHHWDVFFNDPALIASIGVDQVNIVEFGAPAAEGTPSSLHHVPTKKAARVTDTGWSC